MAGATKPEGTAWRRRQQGTGPSEKAIEEVRANLRETIAEKHAAEAASDGDMSADFDMRLARAQVFAKQHGLEWEGPITHGMCAALVEFRAARANHLIRGLAARIAELEKQVAGQQKHVDHFNKHALVFRGDWQASLEYSPGCVVRHRGALYTALKDIPPGKGEPGRNGTGWDHVI